MITREDLMKQAQNEVDAALKKRSLAWQMWQEAGEELVKARLKLEELSDATKNK